MSIRPGNDTRLSSRRILRDALRQAKIETRNPRPV